MAEVSAHLITGHAGDNHITSFNDRQRNRAIYGKGNYRLCAKESSSYDYPYVTAATVNGNYKARVSRGLIMWNGLLIEIDADYLDDDTAYESLNGMNIYLHYERNSSTQVETVKFEFTFDTKTTTANTSFTKTTTNARVLFATFTNASGGQVTYGSGNAGENDFNIVKSATALIKDEATARATAVTNEATARENADAQRIPHKPFSDYTVGTNYDRVLLGTGSTTATAPTAGNINSFTELTLSETVEHFAFIEVRVSLTSAEGAQLPNNILGIYPLAMIKEYGNSSAAGGAIAQKRRIKDYLIYVDTIYEAFASFYVTGTKFKVTPLVAYLNRSRAVDGQAAYYAIYGVGRVSS